MDATDKPATIASPRIQQARRLLDFAIKLRRPLWFALTHPHKLPHLARRALALYRGGRLRAIDERLEIIARHGTRAEAGAAYRRWLRRVEKTDRASRQRIADDIAGFSDAPLISIVMPVYNTRPKWLNKAISSVMRQSYPYWELCIADDNSSQPRTRRVLKAWQRRDARIKVIYRDKNGHISRASNSALSLAGGEFIALLDHDDELPRDALYHVAREIRAHPDAALIYSDEDKIDTRGRRYGHYFKPDYNPELLLSHNMISHLGVYRRERVEAVGGFRVGVEGSQDYDLALRVIETVEPRQIRHIPRILYHWRAIPQSAAAGGLEAKPYTLRAAIRAVEEHLQRTGRRARVEESPLAELNLRVRPHLPDPPPSVTAVIARAHHDDGLDARLARLFPTGRHAPVQILLVHPADRSPPGRADRTLACPRPASLAAMLNQGARQANGELLLFLHPDIEVETPDWLDELAALASQDGIGAVGAKLYDENERIRHAGIVTGLRGLAGHAMRGQPHDDPGYNARAMLIQNYSALSAACLMIRKDRFLAIGGFDSANLPDIHHDIDLCLRLIDSGLRNIWTPHAELRLPGRDRNKQPTDSAMQSQRDYLLTRWADRLPRDPAYNPNLTRTREDFSLRPPAELAGNTP